MRYKYIRFNIIYFFITYIILCGIIFFMSNKFFLNDFILIEKEQNKNNIETFLNNINKDIQSLKNTTSDYSNWDESYEFMRNKNKKYLYENFREGSQTLLELNLDSIMYVNLKNKILFSQYAEQYSNLNKKEFENYLIENFKDENNLGTIISFNSKPIYLLKSQIKRSDKTGENVGYIITTKLVDAESLSKKYAIFKKVNIGNYSENSDLDIKLDYLDTQITTSIDDNYLKNNIQFMNNKKEYVISLITTSERNMIKNSKKAFIIFNLIVYFILFFIFFFTYKNQYLINNQNELLNNQVKRRTKRLKDAYKKLNEKNKELYLLASIDTLTKVKNRRSYFIESNEFLKKSIVNEHNLHVAIIDIDDFKKINDKYGHAIGDEVLITFCEIVNNILDNNTIFARIGGEEFCLTFYNKEENEVNAICEIIRENCARNILIEDNQIITFTISIGLSSKNSSNDSIDKILHKADESLYEAKNTGKNRLIRNRF